MKKSVEKPIVQRKDDLYEIVIIKGHDDQLHLAYKSNFLSENSFENFLGYLDCETGNLIFSQSLTTHTNTPGTAQTRYSSSRIINGCINPLCI